MLIMGAAGVWGSHGPLLSWPSQFLDGPAASTGFAVIKTIGAFGSFLGSYLVGACPATLSTNHILFWVILLLFLCVNFVRDFQFPASFFVRVCRCVFCCEHAFLSCTRAAWSSHVPTHFYPRLLTGVVTQAFGNDFSPALWLMSGQLALCALLMVCFPEPGPGGELAPPWWVPRLAAGAKGGVRWLTGRIRRQGSNGGLGISLVKQQCANEGTQDSPVNQVVPHA